MDDADRLMRGIAGVLRTHYPAFALGLPLRRSEIPIFLYHDVAPADFARDLEFLRRNRYETLSLDGFLRRSAGGGGGRRSVLITFDDARKSFFSCALPVLKDFNARATLFAPTYWMNGTASPPVAHADLFMSWGELRACVESGLVDVQSHAHRHTLVCVSDRIAGFASPDSLARCDIYDWPMRRIGAVDQVGPPPLGFPVYRATPLLSAGRRYLENEELSHACVEFVVQSGGVEFFALRDWATQLQGFHQAKSRSLRGRYQSDNEFGSLIASEFEQSRDEFRNHLGYAPTALAFPWKLGSQRAIESAKHFGIRVTFGVGTDYGRARNPDLPLPAFGRLKADWLRLLPGQGRSSVLTIARRKIADFSKNLPLAH